MLGGRSTTIVVCDLLRGRMWATNSPFRVAQFQLIPIMLPPVAPPLRQPTNSVAPPMSAVPRSAAFAPPISDVVAPAMFCAYQYQAQHRRIAAEQTASWSLRRHNNAAANRGDSNSRAVAPNTGDTCPPESAPAANAAPLNAVILVILLGPGFGGARRPDNATECVGKCRLKVHRTVYDCLAGQHG